MTLSKTTFILMSMLLTCAHVFAVVRPSAVPSHFAAFVLFELPKDDLAALLELLDNPGENAAALLASEDPAEVGLGIFVASFSGDLDRLLAARDLLFDERETIAIGSFPHAVGNRMERVSQSVGDYLASSYRAWFGLDYSRREEVHAEAARIAERNTAWEYAHAWKRRYYIAMTEETRALILAEVRGTPDDIGSAHHTALSHRWARLRATASTPEIVQEIIAHPNETLRLFVAMELSTSGSGGGDAHKENVRAILDSLSPQTRRAIQERTLTFPPDLTYRRDGADVRIYEWYESVTRRAE